MVERAVEAAESMATAAMHVAATYRTARARCQVLIGVDRGNCRTEARAEAKRALRNAQEHPPPA
jgi:hypothetical protein